MPIFQPLYKKIDKQKKTVYKKTFKDLSVYKG